MHDRCMGCLAAKDRDIAAKTPGTLTDDDGVGELYSRGECILGVEVCQHWQIYSGDFNVWEGRGAWLEVCSFCDAFSMANYFAPRGTCNSGFVSLRIMGVRRSVCEE